jgi:hypothetical protein
VGFRPCGRLFRPGKQERDNSVPHSDCQYSHLVLGFILPEDLTNILNAVRRTSGVTILPTAKLPLDPL